MSESSERSPLLNLAVALFDEKIITLMQLESDDNLFCISMPFEINLIEEEDAFWWRLNSSPPMPKATQTA